MGSMIPSSRRKRNQREKRRFRRGLIIASVVACFALAVYVGRAYLSYRADRALIASASEEGDTYGSETLETSFTDYLIPFRTDPPTGTTYTINASTKGVNSQTDMTVISGVTAGSVNSDTVVVEEGNSVTLVATPATGYTFLKWVEGTDTTSAAISTSRVLTVGNVRADTTYTAVFYLSAIRIIYASAHGTITPKPEYVPYVNGKATVSVSIEPDEGYKFLGWRIDNSGSYNSTSTTLTWTFDQPLTVATIVAELQSVYTVKLSLAPSGRCIFPSTKTEAIVIQVPTNHTGDDKESYTVYHTVGPDEKASYRLFDEKTGNQTEHGDENNSSNVVTVEKTTGSDFHSSHENPYDGSARVDLYYNRVHSDLSIVIYCRLEGDSHTENTVVTAAYPANAGVTSGDMSSEAAPITTTLHATPNEGWQFDHWEYYYEGVKRISKEQTFPVSVSGFHSYIAYFVKKECEIKGYCDPVDGGTIVGLGKHPVHSNVTLTTVPAGGYRFDKWTWKDENGVERESTDPSLPFTDLTNDYTVVAHFSNAAPTVTASASPIGASSGGAMYNYVQMADPATVQKTDATTGTVSTTVSNGSNVTLQAFANTEEGYEFAYWVDQDGNTSTSNPYAVSNITDDASYTAIFVQEHDQYKIEAYSDPAEGGTFTGTGWVDAHATATVEAVANTGYKFDKWTWKIQTGLERESRDNPLVLSDVMEDYTLTAHFVSENAQISVRVDPIGAKEGDFNFVDISDTQGHSASTTSGGTGTLTVSGGSAVTLHAVPNKKGNYEFAYFVDEDGNVSRDNPHAVGKVEKDMSFTAIFTSDEESADDGLKVLASPPSGGKVDKEKLDDGSVKIKAEAGSGYTFLYWKCVETEQKVQTATWTVSKAEADQKNTYIAYFQNDKNVKLKSDITEENFPNIRRLFTQPNYKYTRSSWMTTVASFINSIRGNYKGASGTPNDYAAYTAAQTKVEEKSAEYEEIEITARSELITTDNEVIPLKDVADPGDATERAQRIITKKFGAHYVPEILCIKDVSLPEGAQENGRTYLWYDTGAKRYDNLFILYEQDGKDKFATPIADKKGVLRFSIDELGGTNRFVLVRVNMQ